MAGSPARGALPWYAKIKSIGSKNKFPFNFPSMCVFFRSLFGRCESHLNEVIVVLAFGFARSAAFLVTGRHSKT